ncbi:hypothetical protein BD410DRAFT_901758 [Rickenella mellea]|uniref:Galactose oxidase n=1 Tax=Rickenella mellea TaxID=50990 RepID=A0A4Y7PPU1_9AGAM|nr:hypothetical protein BD410DRAFT_901758 [Rickenella mellea]
MCGRKSKLKNDSNIQAWVPDNAYAIQRIDGLAPPFNDGAVYAHDMKRDILYVFGGRRWPISDHGFFRNPTSDFYKLNLRTRKWESLTHKMTFEAAVKLPFIPGQKRVEGTPKPIHPLTHAMGCIYHNPSPHLLLFGGKRKIPIANTDLPLSKLFICINLDTLIWRSIILGGERGVEQRFGAQMVVAGVHLCVFGGRTIDRETKAEVGCSSFCVANLKKGSWVVQRRPLPIDGLVLAASVADHTKVILIGRVEDPAARTILNKLLIFDTKSLSFSTYTIQVADDIHIPPALSFHHLFSCSVTTTTSDADSDSDSEGSNVYALVSWERGVETAPIDTSGGVRFAPTKSCDVWLIRRSESDDQKLIFQAERLFRQGHLNGLAVAAEYGSVVTTMDGKLALLGYSRQFTEDTNQSRVLNALTSMSLQ